MSCNHGHFLKSYFSLVSTLYDCITGQKIAIFEPDEGAYDEVLQLCMKSVFNYSFGLAYISHTENLNEFYLQKSTDGDKIAQLLEDLYSFYEDGEIFCFNLQLLSLFQCNVTMSVFKYESICLQMFKIKNSV